MEVALLVFQVAPHAVQVDRVRHHRVVDEHDAQALAVVEAQRFDLENFCR
jgi:hypothetical protein